MKQCKYCEKEFVFESSLRRHESDCAPGGLQHVVAPPQEIQNPPPLSAPVTQNLGLEELAAAFHVKMNDGIDRSDNCGRASHEEHYWFGYTDAFEEAFEMVEAAMEKPAVASEASGLRNDQGMAAPSQSAEATKTK